MTDEELEVKIGNIPGADGWWKESGKRRFLELAGELAYHGIPNERIAVILETAYCVVAGEYGN